MTNSRSEHVLTLARELLDDLELGRLDAEHLLLKCSRLARWVASEEIQQWISFEMTGYSSSHKISLKYVGLTGRWIDYEKKTAWWGPLAQQEAAIEAEKIKLSLMRIPDTDSIGAIRTVQSAMSACSITLNRLSGIRSRVLARLHSFVASIYYEKQFESLAESIFERYKSDVDSLIAEHCGDVLQKIPSVMERLADGDAESISQALTTCRRIIDSFADSVFPPRSGTYEIEGNQISLDAGKHQNRLNAFVADRVSSASRRQKVRQNLTNLYGRASGGVHSDVSVDEARALFLNTYLFLGELLHLPPSQYK